MKILIITTFFVISCCMIGSHALPNQIVIGGIFDEKDKLLELAFRYAVERINNDPSTLTHSTLIAQPVWLPADDSYRAARDVCDILRNPVAAIFGPQMEKTANHVQSICDAMEIPHIETRWDYKLRRDAYSINLYPYPPSLSEAYRKILLALKWKEFVILYDTNDALVRVQTLLREGSFSVTVRQLEGEDFRPLLKEIRRAQQKRIVLDVHSSLIYTVLKQAAQIGLMGEYYNYFITSLDFNQVDLEEFKYSGTNITGIQLIDPKKLQHIVEDWKFGERRFARILTPDLLKVTTEAALMYDAVSLFAKGLDTLSSSHDVDIEKVYCEGDKTWQHGDSLINYMKWYGSPPQFGEGYKMGRNFSSYSGPVIGLTGLVKFDRMGFRSDFELDIVEMDQNETLKKVGTWSLSGHVNYTKSWSDTKGAVEKNLKNKTLIVMVAKADPYVMMKQDPMPLAGNDQFEGFCIDLIYEISLIRGFNYTFKLVPDGAYGSRDQVTGEWDGIVKQLMDHKADLGIVDFTITYEREEAVDFSMPFMNLGISIIYKKPQKKAPSLFSFTSPFSPDVWLYMATAYLGVSVLLFILARMAPEEWDCPYPCIQDPDELENSFTLLNSLWFIIGTFLCQGADIAPKAVSTRIVAGIWWFFTLIMISSYTANLAAFLTVERMDSPIEGAEDLAKQTKIKYGCKEGGSTYAFFRDSTIPTYQRMWAAMSSARPSVFTDTNEAGVERVSKSNGQYAFLMESSSIEFQVERRCDLMQVGGLLDSKSYGIALPPESPYTDPISSAVLRLKENGKLHQLKTRWWKERSGGRCMTEEKKDAASAAELGLENVGGVFVVMVGGIMLACLTACCEFAWKARKLATDDGMSFTEELKKELLFIVKCNENSKPVRKKLSPADTDTSTVYSSSSTYDYSNGHNKHGY
ncbi:glutamate receptor ionotropic, kainate 2-like isoform X1 [Penaeus vannamei]|uniref:glutamate receptor ionotropic, kainate 2-like isoform X1 n=1 Tax=Penaeus vannamei TaxID=6689 RepID=UPI00387F791D